MTRLINGQNEQTTLVYDPLNGQQQRVLGNGMAVSTLYDQVGNVSAIQALISAGAPLAMCKYTYDAIGNRLAVIELDGSQVTYGYDPSYQLINEQRSGASAYNTTYTYDGAGNCLLKTDQVAGVTTYTYDQANEQTMITPLSGVQTVLSYDSDGNLILENAGGSLTTYAWSTQLRLKHVVYPVGTRGTFTYLADGRRFEVQLASGDQNNFVWDNRNVLQEAQLTGSTMSNYTSNSDGLGSGRFYGFLPTAMARRRTSMSATAPAAREH
jgi:YD repeat-containing protein